MGTPQVAGISQKVWIVWYLTWVNTSAMDYLLPDSLRVTWQTVITHPL